MFVAGVDGCRAGWVLFKVQPPSLSSAVEIVDLPLFLRQRPVGLACIGIDIPIGLLDRPRACDVAARDLLGQPRGCSVFPTPCRAAVQAANYSEACEVNQARAGRRISRQAWGIAAKIKQVDDVLTPEHQRWAFEVHPEVCFWGMNERRPMLHVKKSAAGLVERRHLLQSFLPSIDRHLAERPRGVAADDLLDAAAAAWTALRYAKGESESVCLPERDARGLAASIVF